MKPRTISEFLLANLASVPVLGRLWGKGKNTDDTLPHVAWNGRVLVVGAGAAGLYAAYLLKKSGVTVTLVEASAKPGGRIRTLENFADFPIELGAEAVNGRDNSLYKQAQGSGNTLYPIFAADKKQYLHLDGKLLSEEEFEKNLDVRAAYQLLADIAHYGGPDMTVAAYVNSRTCSPNVVRLARLIGIEAGASNEQISLVALAQMITSVMSIETKAAFRSRQPYLELLGALTYELRDTTIYNSPIKEIDYRSDHIQLFTTEGKSFTADKVIITTPLSVLQKGQLGFILELQENKTKAIANLKVGSGMKIILKFRNRFWKADTTMIAGDTLATYWPPLGNLFGKDNVLTAFAVGEDADRLAVSESHSIKLLLNELDSMYGNRVASENFLDSYIMNWSNEPYIGGYVTYPGSSSYFTDKASLAESVNGKLFFAGEATNTDRDSIGYVHGAMATGARAAKELLATIISASED